MLLARANTRTSTAAITVLVNTMPGVSMMYTGEEVANDRRLSLFEKVGVDWSRPRWLGQLDSALFHLRKANRALASMKVFVEGSLKACWPR